MLEESGDLEALEVHEARTTSQDPLEPGLPLQGSQEVMEDLAGA